MGKPLISLGQICCLVNRVLNKRLLGKAKAGKIQNVMNDRKINFLFPISKISEAVARRW